MGVIEAAGVHIEAVSVGGMETCIEVPAWRLCFDIGRCPPSAHRWGRVLFTHAHIDHMGGIVSHCATRDLTGQGTTTYHVPAENHADVEAMFEAWRRLDRSTLPCTVVPASPGDEFELGPGRVAQAFRAVHRVPTIGWALWSHKKRLKEEYAGLPGQQLGDLRRKGVVFEDVVRVPEIAFCGDTTIDVVDREEVVRNARVLILEVTFLDEQVSVAQARSKGHIHLDEVIERAEVFNNEAIVFTHFSLRHPRHEIPQILARRLPASLKERVFPLLPEHPWSG